MSIMLHITYNYALQILCGAPHNVCNDNGIAENLPLNRRTQNPYRTAACREKSSAIQNFH